MMINFKIIDFLVNDKTAEIHLSIMLFKYWI